MLCESLEDIVPIFESFNIGYMYEPLLSHNKQIKIESDTDCSEESEVDEDAAESK